MSDMPLPVSRNGRKMPPVVRWVTLCLVVVWLALVAGLGWWMSHQAEAAWLDRTAAGADAEAHDVRHDQADKRDRPAPRDTSANT